jgi:hypothetical protein
MKRLGASLKLATVFAAVACVLAAMTGSALAVSIEPLNKKFEGVTPGSGNVAWHSAGIGSWSCGKATLTGTTASTKTNVLEGTPGFLGCIVGGSPITYTNSCGLFKGAPWTLTLNAEHTATLKLNCALVTELPAHTLCTVTVEPQTVTGVTWHNGEGTSLELKPNITFKPLTLSSTCSMLGFTSTAGELTIHENESILINGIHAV